MFPKTKTCKLKSAGWKEKHPSKVLQGSSGSVVCLFKSWTMAALFIVVVVFCLKKKLNIQKEESAPGKL